MEGGGAGGKNIRFWEDTWFGNAPMPVQFWDLYCINNQIGVTLEKIWDGQEVKLTFKRNFDSKMLERWYELEIVSSVVYDQECDALVWAYESNGTYSAQSLYAVINFRGVQPVYIPAVCGRLMFLLGSKSFSSSFPTIS